MISGIQFIAIIFALFMLYTTFIHLKKRDLNIVEAVIFSTVWTIAIIITLFPQSASFILTTFKIYRLLDLATIAGFIFLSAIVFKVYLETKKMRRIIEKLTREIALSIGRKKKAI